MLSERPSKITIVKGMNEDDIPRASISLGIDPNRVSPYCSEAFPRRQDIAISVVWAKGIVP